MSATLTTLVSSNDGKAEGSLLADSRGDLFGRPPRVTPARPPRWPVSTPSHFRSVA
jgi:hypothetical protein